MEVKKSRVRTYRDMFILNNHQKASGITQESFSFPEPSQIVAGTTVCDFENTLPQMIAQQG